MWVHWLEANTTEKIGILSRRYRLEADATEFFLRNWPMSQDTDFVFMHGDDGRFDAVRGRTGFENSCDSNRIERISCEPVHGFCWECDNLAFAKQFDCRSCGPGLRSAGIGSTPMPRAATQGRRQNLRLHLSNFAASTLSLCFLRNASNFFRISSSEVARMAAASSAAFLAPASPIASVPTGIPPGICTVERSESSPCNFD